MKGEATATSRRGRFGTKPFISMACWGPTPPHTRSRDNELNSCDDGRDRNTVALQAVKKGLSKG